MGRTIVTSGRNGQDEPLEVVGVIGDVRHGGLDKPPCAELFRPFTQTFMFPMAMVARTAGPPAQLAAAVRQLAFEIDPVVPVAELQPYTTTDRRHPRPSAAGRVPADDLRGAGLALGLVGVYGVVAYRVRQREREIGIRLALGAHPSTMAKSGVAQGMWHAAAGVAIGIAGRILAVSRHGQHAVRRSPRTTH